jgi:phage-related protein
MEEVTEDAAIRTEFETGMVQSRPRYTRARRTWMLSWEYMRGADYRVLRSFYDQMRGGSLSFDWQNPAELIFFNVRFKGEIRSRNQSADFWNVNVTLEQV